MYRPHTSLQGVLIVYCDIAKSTDAPGDSMWTCSDQGDGTTT